jgi:hypothetical protein
MAQKPILRGEVGARALRVRLVSREEVWASAGVSASARERHYLGQWYWKWVAVTIGRPQRALETTRPQVTGARFVCSGRAAPVSM